MKELSTFKQLKKSLLSLYESWKYTICGLKDKIFDHIIFGRVQKIMIF